MRTTGRTSYLYVFFSALFMACFSIALVGTLMFSAIAGKAETDQNDNKPIRIPLMISQTRAGTYKMDIVVGIGNQRPLALTFDTGSTGLHVFGSAKLDSPESGVRCTKKPISFTVGNPGRITYHGVVCYAPLHFENYSTQGEVPFAYLTSASCANDNPKCTLPDVNNRRSNDNAFGVFGAGLTGPMPVPNPILSLPAPYSSVYSIRLTEARGELVLGKQAFYHAAQFPLTPGKRIGTKWDKGQACIFVDEKPTNSCLAISFDTGNGVTWIRTDNNASIPQENGVVTPQTHIGFGPQGATSDAFDLVAGRSFATNIKMQPQKGDPLTNTGIEAFFDHTITYDNVKGIISVAPLN